MRVTSSIDGLARRWYSHRYNRPDLYGLAARLAWLPRRVRLALARQVGRLAPRLMPAERAAIRKTLERLTGATGARLDGLTARVFVDFAMCFSDLVSTNREPSARLASYVAGTEGVERLDGLTGGLISLTAHVGNWELAGRLLAGQERPANARGRGARGGERAGALGATGWRRRPLRHAVPSDCVAGAGRRAAARRGRGCSG